MRTILLLPGILLHAAFCLASLSPERLVLLPSSGGTPVPLWSEQRSFVFWTMLVVALALLLLLLVRSRRTTRRRAGRPGIGGSGVARR